MKWRVFVYMLAVCTDLQKWPAWGRRWRNYLEQPFHSYWNHGIADSITGDITSKEADWQFVFLQGRLGQRLRRFANGVGQDQFAFW